MWPVSQANPINELDFQVAAKMQKVNRDIEFTFIQGTYNKANSDATVNKTRGLVEALPPMSPLCPASLSACGILLTW